MTLGNWKLSSFWNRFLNRGLVPKSKSKWLRVASVLLFFFVIYPSFHILNSFIYSIMALCDTFLTCMVGASVTCIQQVAIHKCVLLKDKMESGFKDVVCKLNWFDCQPFISNIGHCFGFAVSVYIQQNMWHFRRCVCRIRHPLSLARHVTLQRAKAATLRRKQWQPRAVQLCNLYVMQMAIISIAHPSSIEQLELIPRLMQVSLLDPLTWQMS